MNLYIYSTYRLCMHLALCWRPWLYLYLYLQVC